MLETIGLIEHDELTKLLAELKEIYQTAERGEFVIEEGVEDVHSQVEMILTRRLVISVRRFTLVVHVMTKYWWI